MLSYRHRIMIVTTLFAVIAVAWIVRDPHGLRLWWQLGHDVSKVEQDNAVLTAQVDFLERKAAALRQDPRALERAARESGYVRDDEILLDLK